MNRLLLFPLTTLMAVFGMTLVPSVAKAGGPLYQTRVLHSCQHCRKPVYATYRSVRYVNRAAVYGWVPVYHSNCGSNRVVQSSRSTIITVSPRTSFSLRQSSPSYYSSSRSYSPRLYSSQSSSRYLSFRSSPSLRYSRSYGGSRCR